MLLALTPVADAYIASNTPTTNYGGAALLYTGNLSGTVGRSLYRFDLSAIPLGATVLSAGFQVYRVQGSAAPATQDVELKRIDTAWTEGTVNWNTALGYTGANNVLGVDAAPAYYTWDVTSLVQTWVNGSANNGLALHSKNEAIAGWRGFASRESVAPANPPKLLISYRP